MSSNKTNKRLVKYVFQREYYAVDYIKHDDLLEDMVDNPNKYLLNMSDIKKVEELSSEEMIELEEV
tara:strand:- start:1554 stop:1751 length:198 start_codon:yes stop_codon:yes gene_type:complete